MADILNPQLKNIETSLDVTSNPVLSKFLTPIELDANNPKICENIRNLLTIRPIGNNFSIIYVQSFVRRPNDNILLLVKDSILVRPLTMATDDINNLLNEITNIPDLINYQFQLRLVTELLTAEEYNNLSSPQMSKICSITLSSRLLYQYLSGRHFNLSQTSSNLYNITQLSLVNPPIITNPPLVPINQGSALRSSLLTASQTRQLLPPPPSPSGLPVTRPATSPALAANRQVSIIPSRQVTIQPRAIPIQPKKAEGVIGTGGTVGTEERNVEEYNRLGKIDQQINKYIQRIQKVLNISDEKAEQYEAQKYGKGIDLDELESILKDPANIESMRANLIKYHQWKQTQYNKRIIDFNAAYDHDIGVYKAAGLSDKEINQITPRIVNLLTLSYLKSAVECITNKIRQLSTVPASTLQNDFLRAINDPVNGLRTINDISIANQVSNAIASLLRGYQAFSTDFQNIVITGPAGSGKTNLASTLSFVFRYIHILCLGTTKIVTKPDLVAGYVGHSGPRTRTLLFSALEGILFIDEAYQIVGCNTDRPDPFGLESITEMVNFLDKYVGLSVVVVAGYEKEMEKCFFDQNEGLRRRFPNKFKLGNFDSLQLFRVFLVKVLQSLQTNVFTQLSDILFTYSIIDDFNQRGSFKNQGGDMLILSGRFVKYYLSGGLVEDAMLNAMFDFCNRDRSVNDCTEALDKFQETYDQSLEKLPEDIDIEEPLQ